MCAKLFQSCLTLCDPMDCSLPAPLSMGFSRQEYWSELPSPPPRDLPDPRTWVSYVSCIGSRFFTTSATWEAPQTVYLLANKLSKTELLNSEENIGFQTTFSLDILEDPKFLGVHIAWLQKEWESWTYLPGTSTYLPDIRDNRRPARKVVSLTCLYPYFRTEDKYLANTARSPKHWRRSCFSWYIDSCSSWAKRTGISMSLMAQTVKNPTAKQKTRVQSLGWEDPLEEGMATHSSILAWSICIDRGTWWATVRGVTKSQTWLSE